VNAPASLRAGPTVPGRPRILHLTKVLAVGGAEQLILSLTAAGDRERFDYHVAHVLRGESAHLTDGLLAAGATVHSLGASSHYDLRWLGRLRVLLVAESIDLVHLHLPYTASLGRLVVRSIPRDRRPRIVHTQHNLWEQTTPVVRVLHRTTYRLDDADIAVSEAARSALPAPLRARTEVLMHGLPTRDESVPLLARDEVRAEFDVAADEVLIVTVANLRKEKGYDVLLQAARQLVEEGLPVRFVAVGHGPLEADLRRQRDALGLGRHFTLTGFRSDARRIVAAGDLFVLASHFEAFPVAVMEALAEGVPIVSTAVGDVPRAVGERGAGLIVPRHDPVALADALRRLVVDPACRASMAEAARAAGTEFDIRSTAARVEEIYATLLERGDR
jgi:glycosyltransferase involved in cell wall biosynthesis